MEEVLEALRILTKDYSELVESEWGHAPSQDDPESHPAFYQAVKVLKEHGISIQTSERN